MPLRQHDILRVCEILAEQEELRIATTESFKGACYAFAGAFMGGLLGGPIGLGVGSAAGGVYAACISQGKFKSAAYVLMYEMPEREKQRLADAVQEVITNFDASDVVTIVAMLNANSIVKNMVVDVIKNTLTNNMGLTMV